ncbi:MAG: DUF6471 domain-containing protein [Alphaproteobacteria bacterium]
MTRRGITYERLSELLKSQGAKETSVNPRNKVVRGGFSVAFSTQFVRSMEWKSINISDY